MLQVMIVDDEYMLLRGYRKIIDWGHYGLELAVTEQNPTKALEILRQRPMDILISDMNMPEMDGPSFVAAAKNIRPQMEMIVISGYDNFDYVKAGLQQHAVNYLRKPVNTDELVENLQHAIDRIAQQRQQSKNDLLARQAKTRAVVNETDDTARAELMADLGINFLERSNSIRLIGILNPLPPSELTNYLKALQCIRGFFLDGKDYIILFKGSNVALNYFVNHAPHHVNDKHRPMLIGAPIPTPAHLSSDYAKLKAEIARQYFFESAAGLRVMVTADKQESMPALPGYSEIKTAIAGLDQDGFEDWFLGQIQVLQVANATDLLVRQLSLIVLLVLNERRAITDVKSQAITAINQAAVVSQIVQVIMSVFKQTVSDQRHFSPNVMATCRIVEKKYREALSLSIVADELHLNAVYLGQLFKQDTGRSFSQYLNDYRINVAVDMLRNPSLDVNYIATEVGYQNQSYFYRIFKQQTGMTPLEYREGVERRGH
ncbi:response regulator transcription factor [Lapidilactobacillus gannanensis]|uniref:Helix-turn-helix domain-containing protein n=1 Tax=Lapidilactobacillus gannanensis TaxID=2486002 RepID=A0ABW4BMA5_9LACO|nr:helix-turn-helix domain-containing protein [Lapidilactobacillus gannanensis]